MNMNGTRVSNGTEVNGKGYTIENGGHDHIDIVLDHDSSCEPAILAMGIAVPKYKLTQQEMADLAVK